MRWASALVMGCALVLFEGQVAHAGDQGCPEPAHFEVEDGRLEVTLRTGETYSSRRPWEPEIHDGLACASDDGRSLVFWGGSSPRTFEADEDWWRIGFIGAGAGSDSQPGWTAGLVDLFPDAKGLEVGPDIDVWWNGRHHMIVYAPLAELASRGTRGAVTVLPSGRMRRASRTELALWAASRGRRVGRAVPVFAQVAAERILTALPRSRCRCLVRRADQDAQAEWVDACSGER